MTRVTGPCTSVQPMFRSAAPVRMCAMATLDFILQTSDEEPLLHVLRGGVAGWRRKEFREEDTLGRQVN